MTIILNKYKSVLVELRLISHCTVFLWCSSCFEHCILIPSISLTVYPWRVSEAGASPSWWRLRAGYTLHSTCRLLLQFRGIYTSVQLHVYDYFNYCVNYCCAAYSLFWGLEIQLLLSGKLESPPHGCLTAPTSHVEGNLVTVCTSWVTIWVFVQSIMSQWLTFNYLFNLSHLPLQ